MAAIVLNCDGRDELLGCLAALAASDYPHARVVVVDNGSRDGSLEAVARAHPAVDLVAEPRNLGVSGGRNAGLRRAREGGDAAYVLFVDNDARLAPSALRELVAAAEARPGVGMVTPRARRSPESPELVSAGGMRFNAWTGAVYDVGAGEIDRGQYDRPGPVQACPGFVFLVRSSVFAAIGDFDDAFNPYGWEDVDFSLRAGRAGFELVYAPRALVFHSGGKRGRGAIPERERAKAANLLRLMRRHATPLQWTTFLALLPLRALALAARELARGNASFLPESIAGAWKTVRGR